jgi:lipopolysaccharide transport protein LptA
VGLVLLPLAAGAVESSDVPVSPKAQLAIGVAPFERVAAEGASVPDVATLLADRLATKGVDRIVGPAELGTAASGEPDASVVLEWAQSRDLSAVVVGRTTRMGRSLSVDVQVRSASDGQVALTFVEEVPRPADLGGAVERLADQVLRGLEGESAAEGSGGRVAASEAPSEASSRATPFQGDAPIKISAAQLEAFEEEGRKRLVFTEDVRASQGSFELRARKLEAFYPAKSSQPEKLVATGNVRLSQDNRLARCDKATYFRDDQRVVCAGRDAILTQDDDQLQGREITFHLDSEILLVTGGATVQIQSDATPSETLP